MVNVKFREQAGPPVLRSIEEVDRGIGAMLVELGDIAVIKMNCDLGKGDEVRFVFGGADESARADEAKKNNARPVKTKKNSKIRDELRMLSVFLTAQGKGGWVRGC